MFKIGEGYDVHRFSDNRDLILGGEKIDYEQGLLGHSDADVLIHAIMDALLGAMALGDIGKHFPDTDEIYKGISSIKLLNEVKSLIEKEAISISRDDKVDFKICNIDATIICQKPKLRDYIDEMRKNIADALSLSINQVNIKATTEEGLGFTGRGEGIAARAVTLVEL